MAKSTNLQQTLVLLKPDAVARGIMGQVLARLEQAGLKVIGAKLVQADKKQAGQHYTEEDVGKRLGDRIRQYLIGMLLKGPVLALCIEGVAAIEVVRKLCGTTEPKAALPGTIRGDFSHVSYARADEKSCTIYNVIHAAASPEDAKREIKVWFKPAELLDYQLSAEDFVL